MLKTVVQHDDLAARFVDHLLCGSDTVWIGWDVDSMAILRD